MTAALRGLRAFSHAPYFTSSVTVLLLAAMLLAGGAAYALNRLRKRR